jgi:hypothetical protein
MTRPTSLPPWRWFRLAFAAVLVSGTFADHAFGAPPSLEGQWRVMSATYQLAGPITYDFHGNTLTIVSIQGDKDDGVVPTRYVSRFTFEIDSSVRPNRLIMKSIPAPGFPSKTSVETMEFKKGELWLMQNENWVTGLRRMDPPPPPSQQQR